MVFVKFFGGGKKRNLGVPSPWLSACNCHECEILRSFPVYKLRRISAACMRPVVVIIWREID